MTTLTVDHANNYLQQAGIPCTVEQADIEAAFDLKPASQVIAAFKQAATDQGAKNFLSKLLNTLNIPLQESTETTNQGPSNQAAAQHRDDRQEESTAADENDKKNFRGHHVYGSSNAVEFSIDHTRDKLPTVALDAAAAIQGQQRKYDWDNKIRIQMTPQELPIVAAVLMGYLDKCNFKSHGPQKNKGFELERQDNKIAVKVFQPKTSRIVPMSPSDAFYVSEIVLSQLKARLNNIDTTMLLAILRQTGQLSQPKTG